MAIAIYKTTVELTPTFETLPAKRATYRLSTGLDAPENTRGYTSYYYVECYGENHRNSGVEGNYPAYDGITGLIERRPF